VSALNKVNLELKQGETQGVVGESGCVKPTMARCIMRLDQPTRGQLHFDGQDVFEGKILKDCSYNRRIQMMFQDPYSSLNPRMTTRKILAEALRDHEMRRDDPVDEHIAELLDLVRLPQDAA
jgi:oligopeptide transport system ATP-binding protein